MHILGATCELPSDLCFATPPRTTLLRDPVGAPNLVHFPQQLSSNAQQDNSGAQSFLSWRPSDVNTIDQVFGPWLTLNHQVQSSYQAQAILLCSNCVTPTSQHGETCLRFCLRFCLPTIHLRLQPHRLAGIEVPHSLCWSYVVGAVHLVLRNGALDLLTVHKVCSVRISQIMRCFFTC